MPTVPSNTARNRAPATVTRAESCVRVSAGSAAGAAATTGAAGSGNCSHATTVPAGWNGSPCRSAYDTVRNRSAPDAPAVAGMPSTMSAESRAATAGPAASPRATVSASAVTVHRSTRCDRSRKSYRFTTRTRPAAASRSRVCTGW